MTELTQEQIAQGWIAYAGQSFDPETLVQIYTPSGGTEMGLAGDFDFEQPTADSYEEDPIGSAIDFITMYRILEPVRPSLPSPPVSGEAVTDPDSIFYGASIEEAIETGTWFWQLGRGPMSVSQGGFASFDDAKADLRRLLTGSTEKTRLVNKEWFERMVKLEDGCEISAGTLSPLTNEPVWLGMTDAPRDGTAILGDVDGSAFVVWWDKMHSGWVSGHTDADDELYTRDVNGWMPLPIPQQEVQP